MPNVIYGLHEAGSDEVRYVGKSCQLSQRLRDHEHADCRYWNKLFHSWKSSVAASGTLCARVLEESPADWRVAEITWIRRLRREGHRLLNSHPGGNGRSQGYVMSEETRRRISAAQKGKVLSADHRARISLTLKGRACPWNVRAKISATLKGQKRGPLSFATRQKMSVARTGLRRSPEQRARIGAANKGKLKGRVLSPEIRAKISAALKGRRKLYGT